MQNPLIKTKSLKITKVFLSLISFLLIITQVSCAQKNNTGKIIVSSKGKIESLDPAQASKLLAIQLISSLGDTLYRINSDGNLEPRLAKDLPTFSEDRLTISIPLRENVLFHDGTEFNSYAMAFSLKRFLEIGTLSYVISDRIESIETPERFKLILKLKRPSSSINGVLTSINITPISPKAYLSFKNKFLNDKFIGTGPYKLESFTPERQALIPFEDYWGNKVQNKGINFINYSTSVSLFSAIKSGQVDVLLSNSIEDGHRRALNQLSQKGLLNEGEGPAMQIGYVALRSHKPPLNNKVLRQALSYSINRDLIVRKVSYGLRDPLRSVVPRALKTENNEPWPKYEPSIAKELYKRAGYCNNKKLILPITFRSNVPADKLLALTWQEQVKKDLSECLILELNGVESTTIYKQLGEGSFEAVILGWTGDYPDPEAYLSPLFDCKKINNETCKKGEAVFGGTFWANQKLQNVLKRSELESGITRNNTLNEAEKLASEGTAILPVWLVKPRIWTQPEFNTPEFDGSGRVLLDRLSIKSKNE